MLNWIELSQQIENFLPQKNLGVTINVSGVLLLGQLLINIPMSYLSNL